MSATNASRKSAFYTLASFPVTRLTTFTAPTPTSNPTNPKPAKPAPSIQNKTIKLKANSKNPATKLASDSLASSRAVSPSVDGTITAASSQQGDSAPPPPSNTNAQSQAASQQQGQEQESTTQRCKHCNKQVPKEGFSKHSKQCLRDKQERKRKKQEAQDAKEKALREGKDKDGDAKMSGDGTGVVNDSFASSNGNAADNAGSLPPTASANGDTNATTGNGNTKDSSNKKATKAATEKKNPKKRKAADDTPTDTPKPPTKKQQKAAAAKEAQAQQQAQAAALLASSSTNPTSAAAKPSQPAANNGTTASTNTTQSKPKTSTAKPKGPVDVEKQCGVIMPSGAPCARSLTCKTHAMGAKRAVPGRSLPYDILLQQYQKKNQAKQQKAALAANQPLPEDMLGVAEGGGKVDSDEEREAVMAGLGRAAPRPLWERERLGSVRDRYRVVRMKEVLSNALGGNRGGNLFAVGPTPGAAQAIGKQPAGWNANFTGEDGQGGGARRTSSVAGQGGARQMPTGQNDAARKGSVGPAGVAAS